MGGLRDAVHDNFNGFVVNTEKEYAQALEYLYHHPEERKKMGENARNYAERVYGGDNCARRFDKIYTRMLERPKQERIWPEWKGAGLDSDQTEFVLAQISVSLILRLNLCL